MITTYHAPGYCRNCGDAHTTQKCPEILTALFRDEPCEIPLANNKGIALVDAVDYEVVARFDWYLHSQGYAATKIGGAQAYMHHFIIKTRPGHVVDHINRSKLDNRRSNLRTAHFRQNAYNSKNRDQEGKHSQYRGVTQVQQGAWKRWTAQIRIDGKRIHLGYFQDETEAARAYDVAAREHHGEFARVNFPDSDVAQAPVDPETPDPSPPPWDAPAIVRKTIVAWQCNRAACAQWLALFNDAEQRMLAQAVIAYRRQFYPTDLTVDRLVSEWRRAA